MHELPHFVLVSHLSGMCFFLTVKDFRRNSLKTSPVVSLNIFSMQAYLRNDNRKKELAQCLQKKKWRAAR